MSHYLHGKPITKKSLQKDLEYYEGRLLQVPSLSALGKMYKDIIREIQDKLQEVTKGEK